MSVKRQKDPLALVYIYALVDPFTDEIRYVGKSIRPVERLVNHCNEQANSWRNHWIQSILSLGKRPILKILQELKHDEDWQAAERKWIADLKADGVRLTNCTSGGDGVPDLPPEILAKRALTWVGKKHKPETLAKMSRDRKGRKHTQASKDAMHIKMTGRVITWKEELRKAVQKFTDEQAKQICLDLNSGMSQYAIARKFNTDQGTISNIRRRRTYKDISAIYLSDVIPPKPKLSKEERQVRKLQSQKRYRDKTTKRKSHNDNSQMALDLA